MGQLWYGALLLLGFVLFLAVVCFKELTPFCFHFLFWRYEIRYGKVKTHELRTCRRCKVVQFYYTGYAGDYWSDIDSFDLSEMKRDGVRNPRWALRDGGKKVVLQEAK